MKLGEKGNKKHNSKIINLSILLIPFLLVFSFLTSNYKEIKKGVFQ